MDKLIDEIYRCSQAGADALNSLGYRADFSISSLRNVDRFFDDHSVDGVAKAGGELAEDTGSRILMIGTYVGESIRRTYGGQWIAVGGGADSEWNAELHLRNGSIIWPMQKTAKRFRNGPEDAIYPYALLVAPA